MYRTGYNRRLVLNASDFAQSGSFHRENSRRQTTPNVLIQISRPGKVWSRINLNISNWPAPLCAASSWNICAIHFTSLSLTTFWLFSFNDPEKIRTCCHHLALARVKRLKQNNRKKHKKNKWWIKEDYDIKAGLFRAQLNINEISLFLPSDWPSPVIIIKKQRAYCHFSTPLVGAAFF